MGRQIYVVDDACVIQYFHYTEEIDHMLPIGLLPTFLILSTSSCLFHLLQHKDFANLLPLFYVIVSSCERSPFLHMLHAQYSTSNISTVIVYDCMKTIVEMTNPSNYNPSILVICILKASH